jgi:hypothetical protein
MADPSTPPDTSGGMPRWVKVFAVIGVAVVALFVVTMAVGGGHGPGRHAPPAETPSSPSQEHAPPAGGHQ